MSAKTTTVGSRTSHQSLEQSAGLPEPADPGAHYCVDPGETAREYFPSRPGQSMLEALTSAIARAAWLSVALLAPCQDKVIRRYRGGREIWSAASKTPDPGDDPPGRLTLALKGM
jgi:hypothetical protein